LPAFKRVTLRELLFPEKIFCCKCGRELNPGDRVWAHYHLASINKYYCLECYEKLWY
jgi:uncharacterized protein with PIN domain